MGERGARPHSVQVSWGHAAAGAAPARRLKVCLINPPRLMKSMSVILKASPPLGLAFVAAALRAHGSEVNVLDSLAEGYYTNERFKPGILANGLSIDQIARRIPADVDLIGLSLMFSGNWPLHRTLIDELGTRFPNAIIVAGGEHVTAVPELCIEQTRHLAVCVLGEGEATIVDLAGAIERDEPFASVAGIVYRSERDEAVRNPARARITDLGTVHRPAWELFPLDDYREKGMTFGVNRGASSLPLLATRGCPYRCTFCSSPQMWGTRYVMRSPHEVVDEIEYCMETFAVRNFDFYDLTAIIKKSWIIDFCRELERRDLRITWQIPAGTRSEAIDQEVAHHIYRAGCRNITYAPESGSRSVLRSIKKKVNLDRMLRSISFSAAERMNIKINFMIGFPEETHRDIWESIWFLIKASWHGAHDMSPSIFSPYPGSEAFAALVREGKINLADDRYFERIVHADTPFRSHFYNDHIGNAAWRVYLFVYLIVFYLTNYLSHPTRILRTAYNLLSNRPESRAEMSFVDLLARSKVNAVHEGRRLFAFLRSRRLPGIDPGKRRPPPGAAPLATG